MRINKVIDRLVEEGRIVYQTKSNNNFFPDKEHVAKNQVIGKVIIVVPFLGIMLEVLQSKITTIFIIIFLILKFTYNKKVHKRELKKMRNLRKP